MKYSDISNKDLIKTPEKNSYWGGNKQNNSYYQQINDQGLTSSPRYTNSVKFGQGLLFNSKPELEMIEIVDSDEGELWESMFTPFKKKLLNKGSSINLSLSQNDHEGFATSSSKKVYPMTTKNAFSPINQQKIHKGNFFGEHGIFSEQTLQKKLDFNFESDCEKDAYNGYKTEEQVF